MALTEGICLQGRSVEVKSAAFFPGFDLNQLCGEGSCIYFFFVYYTNIYIDCEGQFKGQGVQAVPVFRKGEES
ncbi:hypothetical protein [Comamonas guangdongensis]|uniref:Uncharacterized protein n=1 Tax=Comamonas guangdongensis TaxID=510515 RepID=A0ABV3ZYB4_9BURK